MKYLPHTTIDRLNWDKCITQAHNSMPYAYSWYLDMITNGQWDALVWGNYEVVMPLPYQQKWGIRYIYVPFWAQQLGVFSTQPLNQGLLQEFMEAIPKHFQYIDLLLNEGNHFKLKDIPSFSRANYVLALNKPYAKLHQKYNNNTKRNLKKAHKLYWQPLHLNIIENISPSDIIQFYQEQVSKHPPHITPAHFQQLEKILYQCVYKKIGFSLGVYDEYNVLCGVNFFIQTPKRLINMVSLCNAIGREYRVTFVLLDKVIQQFADSHYLLDFEGSMIPSIAQFYSSFGAQPIPYQHIHWNRLPWYLRWLKK